MRGNKRQIFVLSRDRRVFDAIRVVAGGPEPRIQLRPITEKNPLPTVAGMADWLILDPDHPQASSARTIQLSRQFPGHVVVLQRGSAGNALMAALSGARALAIDQIADEIRGEPAAEPALAGKLDARETPTTDPHASDRMTSVTGQPRTPPLDDLFRVVRRLATLNRSQLYEATAEEVAKLFGATRCSFYEYDGSRSTLTLRHATAGRDLTTEVRVGPDSASPMARAVNRREVQLVEDWTLEEAGAATDDPANGTRPYADRYQTNSSIIVPVVAGAELIGVVNLTDRADDGAFQSDADLPLARCLSDLLATAWQNVRLYEQSQLAARADGLTGLANYRTFTEHLGREVTRARRYGTALSLIMIDVDGLKPINDMHGHQAGDWVLQGVAVRMAAGIREIDLAARCGGDEFAVILPNTALASAHQVAQRLVDDIHDNPVTWKNTPLRISISLGVGEYAGQLNVEEFTRSIDLALYEAKTSGRNRVTVHRVPPSPIETRSVTPR